MADLKETFQSDDTLFLFKNQELSKGNVNKIVGEVQVPEVNEQISLTSTNNGCGNSGGCSWGTCSTSCSGTCSGGCNRLKI